MWETHSIVFSSSWQLDTPYSTGIFSCKQQESSWVDKGTNFLEKHVVVQLSMGRRMILTLKQAPWRLQCAESQAHQLLWWEYQPQYLPHASITKPGLSSGAGQGCTTVGAKVPQWPGRRPQRYTHFVKWDPQYIGDIAASWVDAMLQLVK